MLPPDTLLNDRYQIIRLIGQGGMGAVYEAIDQRLRARVALKQTTVAGEGLSRAFEHEAQLLAGLRHPALPRVIDHFIDAGGQFLVMEFIPGEDLAALLKARAGAFPLGQVLGWADTLLDALEYIHGQQPPVIHRDIKPQNLKLTPRGEIILLDFGLAKGSVALATQAEGGASVFGYTPQYAPMEQVQGTGTDARSDLYSLAATLYHLLTGQAPADTLARAAAVLNGRPDPLRPADAVNPGVPPAVAGALGQALALRADERFASAAAMRRALREAAAEAPQAATGPTVVARRPPTLAPPPPARVEPPRAPEEAPTDSWVEPPARRAAPPPEARPGRPGMRRWIIPLLILGLLLALALALGDSLLSLGRPAAPSAAAPTSAAAGATADPAAAPAPPPAGEAITLDARIQGEIASAGQRRAYSFSLKPGQQVFVWSVKFDAGMDQIKLRLLDDVGDEVAGTCLGCGNMGVVTLKKGGAYTLTVGSDSDPATGAFELRVNLVPPTAAFTLPIDARIAGGQPGAGAGEVAVPGAKDAYSFAASAGQQVFVWSVKFDSGMDQIKLRLLDSLGDEVANTCLGCGNMGVVTLKQGGSYTLAVGSDNDPATGAYEIRMSAVPPATAFEGALPLTVGPDAPGKGAGAIGLPGAKQIYRFEASPGQQIFVTTARSDAGMDQIKLRLLDSLGDEVANTCLGCGNMGAQTLRKGGAYTLVVGSDNDPATGAYELKIDPVQ